ncbi:SETMR methyltransferase, partial [Acromyrmex heyeri]
MDSKLEQRTCIKFCCKNEIKCSDTLKMLQKCYGDDTLSKTQVYQWYERFKSGREAVEDDARPGRPSTLKTDENVDEIRQLLIENRKLTIREIAETTNISFGSVQSILREDLGLILHDDNIYMWKLCAKIVPKVLTDGQKLRPVVLLDVSNDWIENAQDLNFFKRMITGDESWIYEYNPATKKQSEEWKHHGSPHTEKARKSLSKIKIAHKIYKIAYKIRHAHMHEVAEAVGVSYGTTFNILHDNLGMKKLSAQWVPRSRSAHSSAVATVELRYELLPHLPYFADLAPCDFFLFPNLKFAEFDKSYFSEGLKKWQKRWEKYILLKGDYVEK